jgi:hypothetical protein
MKVSRFEIIKAARKEYKYLIDQGCKIKRVSSGVTFEHLEVIFEDYMGFL